MLGKPELTTDHVPGEPKVFFSFTIQKCNPLFSTYVLQSAKYELSSLSRVFDAVTAVTDERAVLSCTRSLTA